MIEYVVQKGDTIASITQRFGVTWDRLRNTNPHAVGRLESNGRWFLRENETLTLDGVPLSEPIGTFTDELETCERETTLQVRPGDTLWSLSKKHGVSVDAIARANSIKDPNTIFAGDLLRIPLEESPSDSLPSESDEVATAAASPNENTPETVLEAEALPSQEPWLEDIGGDIFPMPLYEAMTSEKSNAVASTEESTGASNQVAAAKTVSDESSETSEDEFHFPRLPVGIPGLTSEKNIEWGPVSLSGHCPEGTEERQLRLQYRHSSNLESYLGVGLKRYRRDPDVDPSTESPEVSVLVGFKVTF